MRLRAGTLTGLAALGVASILAAGGAAPVQAAPVQRLMERPAATAPGSLDGMVVDALARKVPSKGGVSLVPQGVGDLTGRVVVVDPGHNGAYRTSVNTRLVAAGNGRKKACNSSGTATNAGYSEHRFNWAVAVRLVGDLRARGATVVLTQPSDAGTGPCVNERASIGNRARADLVVSIHADGSHAAGARGFHLIVSRTMVGGSAVEATSRAFALHLRSLIGKAGMPRSTYIGKGTALSVRSDIAGLNLSRVPGVMLEAGNMRNRKDARLLTSAAFQQKLADALTDGVVEALRG